MVKHKATTIERAYPGVSDPAGLGAQLIEIEQLGIERAQTVALLRALELTSPFRAILTAPHGAQLGDVTVPVASIGFAPEPTSEIIERADAFVTTTLASEMDEPARAVLASLHLDDYAYAYHHPEHPLRPDERRRPARLPRVSAPGWGVRLMLPVRGSVGIAVHTNEGLEHLVASAEEGQAILMRSNVVPGSEASYQYPAHEFTRNQHVGGVTLTAFSRGVPIAA